MDSLLWFWVAFAFSGESKPSARNRAFLFSKWIRCVPFHGRLFIWSGVWLRDTFECEKWHMKKSFIMLDVATLFSSTFARPAHTFLILYGERIDRRRKPSKSKAESQLEWIHIDSSENLNNDYAAHSIHFIHCFLYRFSSLLPIFRRHSCSFITM